MSTLPKRKFREIVFQLLYSQDFSDLQSVDMSSLVDQLSVARSHMRSAQDQVVEIQGKLPEIDALIEEAAIDYAFDRIQRIERNILRLGVFELLYDDGLPPKVTLSEAIRLCRKFGTAEGAHFVNAVLDRIYHQQFPEGPKPEDKMQIYWGDQLPSTDEG